MTPTAAAVTLVRAALDEGLTTTQMVTTFRRHDAEDFCAGIGVHGGTVACPGTPGFVTVTRLGERPVCHRFGLHQMVALIKNGYPRPGFGRDAEPSAGIPAPEAIAMVSGPSPGPDAPPRPGTEPSAATPTQASLF